MYDNDNNSLSFKAFFKIILNSIIPTRDVKLALLRYLFDIGQNHSVMEKPERNEF